MSYARFGTDSSVYVFLDVSGYFNCCGCRLAPGVATSTHAPTTAEMLAHLEEHRAAGHLVPDYCLDGLRDDRDENDSWIRRSRRWYA